MERKFIIHSFCNFCSSRKKLKLFSFGKQNLILCKGCYLIFFDKQRIDLENLYNEGYYSLNDNNDTANYANYQSQEKTILKDFAFAYNFIKKNNDKGSNNLLEIGPGFGYFLKHLPGTLSYEAVEVSKNAVLNARKGKIKIYEGDFLKIPIKRKYDYIVAFDVIEHQIYIKKFLEKIHLILKPNGIFIFTTPDYGSLLNRIFRKNAPTIQPMYHNYYFNQKWLKKNLRLMDFKIEFIKTVHITYLSIGQIFLMGSFAYPFIKILPLNKILRKLRIDEIIIPFLRFGGIQCIVQKR